MNYKLTISKTGKNNNEYEFRLISLIKLNIFRFETKNKSIILLIEDLNEMNLILIK